MIPENLLGYHEFENAVDCRRQRVEIVKKKYQHAVPYLTRQPSWPEGNTLDESQVRFPTGQIFLTTDLLLGFLCYFTNIVGRQDFSITETSQEKSYEF